MLGGALAANVHGRGLRLRPFVADLESFTVLDPAGHPQICSRTTNPRLFALAAGGYGLFGPVTTMTLRLQRRQKIERRVTIVNVEDLPELFDRRVREGYDFGDCQFATDPASREFLESRRVPALLAGGARRAAARATTGARRPRMAPPAPACPHRQVARLRRVLALLHGDRRPALLERYPPALGLSRGVSR